MSCTKYSQIPVWVFLFFSYIVQAQSLTWESGFNGFFDNREYFNPYVQPQTMFGSHAFAAGGIALNNHQRFVAGADFLYEFGGTVQEKSVQPIVYFNLQKDFFNMYLGAFPRHQLVTVPLFMLSDTLQYYRPNVEGIYLEAHKSWGSQNVWLDWTSRQTDVTREIFQIGGSGYLKKGAFYYRHHFIMTHYAGPAIPIPDDHIRDNGGAFAGIGLQYSHSIFDSVSLGTGYVFNYDRLRNVYDSIHHGSLSHLYLELHGFGIRASQYLGNGQTFISGDGLYSAPSYQRIDLIWKIFRTKQVSGKVEFSFHIMGNILDMSQSFTIYAKIGHNRPLSVPEY